MRADPAASSGLEGHRQGSAGKGPERRKQTRSAAHPDPRRQAGSAGPHPEGRAKPPARFSAAPLTRNWSMMSANRSEGWWQLGGPFLSASRGARGGTCRRLPGHPQPRPLVHLTRKPLAAPRLPLAERLGITA